ncbi:MAG: dihydropteroate synthase [bacterium]
MYQAGPYKLLFRRPILMGVINVTPDSFSDGGEFFDATAAIAHGSRLISEGADWLDIGGESTRPGANPITVHEESRRVIPVIEGLKDMGVPLSIDTIHPEVAERAVKAGAVILNDIAGGSDPALARVAALHNLPYIVMHMQGTPKTMQSAPQYADVSAEVFAWLGERCTKLQKIGVTQLLTDVGIGFGKTLAHNLTLIHQLEWFLELGFPIAIGTSRKSWIQKALGKETPMSERIESTIAANVLALEKGARVFRVHDVAPNLRALKAAWGIMLAEKMDGDNAVPWPKVVERV